jgi:Zn-finger nucleic acid-binding protein
MQLNVDRGCFVCPYCESEFVPQANVDGVRVMGPSDSDCPLCKTKLAQGRLLEYGLLYCETCQGMLIPMGDLERISEDLRASRGMPAYTGLPPDARALDRKIACPTCQQIMDTHLYGGPGNVILDSCESCEVLWLDRGELRRIALAPDHHYST